MTSVSNSTPSGLVEVTPGSADTTERVVGDMDVTVAVSGGAVDIDVNLWASSDQFGTHKFLTARVRRDNVSGAVLATSSFGEFGSDDNGGHSQQFNVQFTDSAATTGRYVVTLQATPNAARVYSDTHSITITSPSTAVLLSVPVGAVASAGLAASASFASNLPVPAGAVTLAAPSPTLRVTPQFTDYDLDANSSQALTIPVQLSGVLEVDVKPTGRPSRFTEPQIRASRLSLVMPPPSLDSRGRPS